MELLRCLATYELASRIGYELHGCQVEFLRHSDMWELAIRIGYEVCGWELRLPRNLTMWGVRPSTVDLCGRQINFLRYLAMRVGHI